MKLLLTLFLALSLSVSTAKAQTIDSVVIDMRNLKNTRIPEIAENELFYIKINDINLNLYKVSIETKDTTISTALSIPTFESVGLDGLTKVVTELSNFNKFGKTGKNEIIKKFEKTDSTLIAKANALKQIDNSIDRLDLDVQLDVLSYLVENPADRLKLGSKVEYDTLLEKSKIIRQNINKLRTELENSSIDYQSFFIPRKDLIEKNAVYKARHNKITEAFQILNGSIDTISKSINANRVAGWISSIIHLKNNSNRVYRSLPMQLTKEFKDINILIEPKKDEYGLPTYQTTLQYPGGLKFYYGIGMSFYASNLRSNNFGVITTQIDSSTYNYNIVAEEQDAGEIGLTSLLHFGIRIGNYKTTYIHGSIGPALSLSSPIKPRLAAGVGISKGKKQKIALDFLVMAGPVTRLSNAYNTSTTYTTKPENITTGRLMFRGAVALGYIYQF